MNHEKIIKHGSAQVAIYDDFTIALSALQGLGDLVNACGEMIEPGRFGPLFSQVIERFTALHEDMKSVVHAEEGP